MPLGLAIVTEKRSHFKTITLIINKALAMIKKDM